jgi:hypothetical protein
VLRWSNRHHGFNVTLPPQVSSDSNSTLTLTFPPALSDPENLWKYCPSLVAALIFFALFGFSSLFHIYQAIKFRKSFCWVLIMGGIWETIAYITRFYSAQHPTKSGVYDITFVLLLLAPLWINAFDYMVLGRMVWFFLPGKKLIGIRASMMGVIFVCLDIL